MSTIACNSVIDTDLAAGTWNLTGLRVGFEYAPPPLYFKDQNGVEIDITGDDFEMVVTDSGGTVVETLTVGSGIVIVADNQLNVTIGSPTTDTAGRYAFDLIWTRPSTSWNAPVLSGYITVKA